VTAVIVPNRLAMAEKPSFSPISAVEVLRAGIRTNLYQFAGERDDGLSFFSRLLSVPCYRLDLTPDPVANGDALAGLFRGAA